MRYDAEVLGSLRERLKRMDEVRDWPLLVELIDRPVQPHSKPCWEYAFDSCEAVDGARDAALPAAASIFCLLLGIHLVDDLLDEDPQGIFHRVGAGTAANAALALQGVAARVVAESDLSPQRQALAQAAIGRMTLATAYGQNLDVADLEGEESYWRVVRHKTPPLFSCALELGAICGGASGPTAGRVSRLGLALGEIVQISDDLKDAMERPAGPDWQRRWTNLPILFARTAEHADQDRFEALLPRVHLEGPLKEAQEILVRSGALSYCAYRIIQSFREANAMIHGLGLPSPEPLQSLIKLHVEPLEDLLRFVGVEAPAELFATVPPRTASSAA